MKKILATLAAGTVLVATPAVAACNFTGEISRTVGSLIGDASVAEVSVEALTNAVLSGADKDAAGREISIKGQLAQMGCDIPSFVAKTLSLNGGNASKLVTRSDTFEIPKVGSSSAAAPSAPTAGSAQAEPAPQATSVPAPQASPAVAPVQKSVVPVVAAPLAVKPLPARVNLSDVWGAINALKTSDTEIRNELSQVPVSQLTPEQLTLLNQLNAVPDLEAKLRNLPANGEVQTSTLPVAQQVVVQQVIAAQSLAEKYIGRGWLDWMTVGNSVSSLIFLILAFFGIRAWRKRDKDIKTAAQVAVNEALDGVKLDDTFKMTLLARVGVVEGELLDVREEIKDVREQAGTPDIRFAEGDVEALSKLLEGAFYSAHVVIGGEKKFEICFRRIENELFVADEPKSKFRNHNPVSPIKDPLRFIRTNFRDGEFDGFMNVFVLDRDAA